MTEIAAPPARSGNADLRGVVDRFGEAAGESARIRDEIAASWQRCALAGVRPERFVVPYSADIDEAGRLAWAAAPIVAQLTTDLEGTRAALILTDEHAHVLARTHADRPVANRLDGIHLAPGFVYLEDTIGTNAIGTALASTHHEKEAVHTGGGSVARLPCVEYQHRSARPRQLQGRTQAGSATADDHHVVLRIKRTLTI